MGQYIYGGGAQDLTGKHWKPIRDFFGGSQPIGWSLMVIAGIGFLGIVGLAITDGHHLYNRIMWVFSILATAWFWSIGIAQGYINLTVEGAGSTGVWTLGLAGCFFLFTRLGISLARSKD